MFFTRSSQIILVVLFIAALWIPLLVMLAAPTEDISRSEKRRLASAPVFSLATINKFAGEFEKYLNDHFGLRQQLVRAYNSIRIEFFNSSGTEWVLVGKDGWLFHGGEHISDMRNANPYSAFQLNRWAEILEEKQKWIENRGIKYLFMFVPNKHLLYPQFLPRYLNEVSEVSRLDQLVDHLRRSTNVRILDVRPALTKAAEVLRTHHATDTHWNAYGGYIAYRALMDELKPDFPELSPLELKSSDFETVDAPGGDLAQILDMQDVLREQNIRTRTPVAHCARNTKLGANPTYAQLFNHAFATHCDKAPYRVLMFRDSYSFELMPYLSESFGYIYYHINSPVPVDVLKKLVEEHKPDLVIEQRSSRWLRMPQG